MIEDKINNVEPNKENPQSKLSKTKEFLKELITPVGIIALGIAVIAPTCLWYHKSIKIIEGKRSLNLKEQQNIERISFAQDYNKDGYMDYIVQYKDGRSEIFYGRGFDREDITDKVKWNWENEAKIEDE